MPQSPDEELQPPGSGIGQKASSVLGQAAAGLVTGVVPGLTQTVSDAGQAIAQSEQGIGSQRAGSGSFPEKPQVDLSGLSASGPVTQSQTQSTYQSPDFDPRLFPQYQRNMQEHLQRVEDISRQREVVIGQKAEIYNKWITQNQADSEKYGRMADEYLGKFQAAEKQLEGIKARLDSLEPDEVLGAASDAQSIVAALGMALSRYSTLGTGGAINLLNQMEKQNMEKHRIKMAKTLQLAGLTKDQMNAAWGQYMSFEGRRREATQGLIQMELANAGLESDRIDVRAKYADIINASNSQLLEKKNATRAKTSSTTVTKTSTGGTSAQPIKTADAKSFGEQVETLRGMVDVKRAYQKLIKAGATGKWDQIKRSPAYQEFEAVFTKNVAGYVKSISGATVTKDEYDRLASTFAKSTSWRDLLNRTGDILKINLDKMNSHIGSSQRAVVRSIKANPGLVRIMDKDDMNLLR